MRKIICLTIIVTLLLVCLSSCSGYNKIMIAHLSAPENYHTYKAVVVDMYYQNPQTRELLRNFASSDCCEQDVTIVIKLWENIEEILPFLGSNPDPDVPLESYEISLFITADNSKVLYENGFYEAVSIGDKIEVTASNWIYMDGNFFYVAQVVFDDVVYLNFEDGLHNILDMMNQNKSLF